MKISNIGLCPWTIAFALAGLIVTEAFLSRRDAFGQDPVASQVLPSQSQLVGVGGWQMQPGVGAGFSRGGLYVERRDQRISFFMAGGSPNLHQQFQFETQVEPLGSMGSDQKAWPVAVKVKALDNGHLDARCDFYLGRGVCRPNGNQLLFSSYSSYAATTKSMRGPWMSWVDETNGPTSVLAVPESVNRRQVFGGGFVTIPQWFANKYLDGRNFGIGHGGYLSGQGSSLGPTLLVADRPTDGEAMVENATVLLEFASLDGDPTQMERRPGDYSNGMWVPEPDETGLGYGCDTVTAGPVWIDTPTMSGLCYWTVQGIGELDYALQRMGFSMHLRTRMYCYSPETLSEVATGQILPSAARATITEWTNPFDTSEDTAHYPCGAYWDDQEQFLYVSYYNAGNHQYEPPPVVVRYSPSEVAPPEEIAPPAKEINRGRRKKLFDLLIQGDFNRFVRFLRFSDLFSFDMTL